ncbi:DUF664 domain-containing protein [Luteipulveratus sp. YIM 133132]|uniref:mycothiol transferase n=1 Tax=Luteipulveratus flavus TaxID=3031728 RepID=UPI0023AF5780|nr:DUF664 domain-containing protein [Luteipulveratus sp. YIM 133132]MDE9365124.1 DUF664 domain-containing protein [Luteipulveratus sp. YIM 133132]
MSAAIDILTDGFDRVHDNVGAVLDGLTTEQLLARPTPRANSVAWLVWHLSRVQDSHIAGLLDTEQVWHSEGFADRFALPYDASATGYGQSPEEVGAFRVADPALLREYHEAAHELTLTALKGLTDQDLGEVIDRSWDPPVTKAVRLVSVVDDAAQHVGQAAYVRGLVT